MGSKLPVSVDFGVDYLNPRMCRIKINEHAMHANNIEIPRGSSMFDPMFDPMFDLY
jgi:hypothetical protein